MEFLLLVAPYFAACLAYYICPWSPWSRLLDLQIVVTSYRTCPAHLTRLLRVRERNIRPLHSMQHICIATNFTPSPTTATPRLFGHVIVEALRQSFFLFCNKQTKCTFLHVLTRSTNTGTPLLPNNTINAPLHNPTGLPPYLAQESTTVFSEAARFQNKSVEHEIELVPKRKP